MNFITLTAPAKVNLFLKILNKRKDSYHNIVTIFERISLSDTVIIKKSVPGIHISSDKFITASPEDNIAFKAAKAVFDYKKTAPAVSIFIKKEIPIAAGLGGGSSDAACVLSGINRLFNMRIAEPALVNIAAKIGADIPFFMLNKPFALGRGIGDRLSAINSKATLWHLLIYPGFKAETKGIYTAFDRNTSAKKALFRGLTKSAAGVRIQRHLGNTDSREAAGILLYNDLERALISKKPVIGKILNRLADILGTTVIVSGSGPSLFCLCETRKEADRAKGKVMKAFSAAERKGWRLFAVKTLI